MYIPFVDRVAEKDKANKSILSGQYKRLGWPVWRLFSLVADKMIIGSTSEGWHEAQAHSSGGYPQQYLGARCWGGEVPFLFVLTGVADSGTCCRERPSFFHIPVDIIMRLGEN